MKAYFMVNPSTYTSDDAKSVTLLNRMNKGQGGPFAETWLDALADPKVKMADKTFEKVTEAFASTFYPYHRAETARDELNNLRQVMKRKDNRFQTYLSIFQNLIVQSQAGDTPEVQRLFTQGLDVQIATMIYSMEKVPDTLKGWMEKAIDFHKQQAHIITLKKGHGLPLSSLSSNSHSTRDPDTMEVDVVCLKKLSPAEHACCIREELCFRCCKKGHSVNECQSSQTQGNPKGNHCLQLVRNAETSSSSLPPTATVAPVNPH